MNTQSHPQASGSNTLGQAFTHFMASTGGRIARGVLGIAVIALGVAVIPAPAGYAVAAFGLVPLGAGIFNLCPVAPLWGGHFLGASYCRSGGASPSRTANER